jgi:hypothetical protein
LVKPWNVAFKKSKRYRSDRESGLSSQWRLGLIAG